MPTPSAAAWPIPVSIARRVLELTLVVATLVAASAVAVTAAERGAAPLVEPHDGFDRIVLPADPARPPAPLVRRADGSYRVVPPAPIAAVAGVPRGLSGFLTQRNADGSIGAIDLVPAPGTYLRYRMTGEGIVLEVVHGIRAPVQTAAAPVAPAPQGPLPPKVVHAGVLFAAPRLAALRLGDDLILILPSQSDLDPAAIPPARVAAVTAVDQGRHRVVRMQLRPDTRIEIAREGAQQWRLGFGPDAAIAPARTRFTADGRSVVVEAEAGAAEFVTLNLPELGAVAVVLAAGEWAMAAGRSPYLDVLGSVIGGVVVPRTDSLAIERRSDGIAISGISRKPGG